jgi:hypothetical protein
MITCHIWSGASITAVKNGKSIDTPIWMFHPLLPVPLDHTSQSAFPMLSTRLWLLVLTLPVGHLICNFRHHIASVLLDKFSFFCRLSQPFYLSSLCKSGACTLCVEVCDCSLVDPYRI